MPIVSRPRTVGTLPVSSCFRFSPLVCFFKAGLLLHLECVSIGKLIAIPPGDRPSHSISVATVLSEPRPQGSGTVSNPSLLGPVEAEGFAEVDAFYFCVLSQLVRAAGTEDLPRIDDVSTIRNAERLAHVVIGHQNSKSVPL